MNSLIIKYILLLCVVAAFAACSNKHPKDSSSSQNFKKGTFGHHVNFLKKYTDVIVLSSSDSLGQVLVTPKMQGRVMTSTTEGDSGKSLGWVNDKLIASGKTKSHMTPYGGEDRLDWAGRRAVFRIHQTGNGI